MKKDTKRDIASLYSYARGKHNGSELSSETAKLSLIFGFYMFFLKKRDSLIELMLGKHTSVKKRLYNEMISSPLYLF